ncbi:hypothetical protein Vretifemale_1720, partial [Volvox reticuliferus]
EAAAAELRAVAVEQGVRREAAEAVAAELWTAAADQRARHEAAAAQLRAAVAKEWARRKAAEAATAELWSVVAEQGARREAAEAAAAELRAVVVEQGVRREAAEAAAAELRTALAEQVSRHEGAEASTAELQAVVVEQGVRCEAAEAAAAELRAVMAEEGARREAAEASAAKLRIMLVKLEEQVQHSKAQITRCDALEDRFANVQKSMKQYRFQSRRLKRLLKQARGQAVDAVEEDSYLNDEDDVHMAQFMSEFEEPSQSATIPAPFESVSAPSATQPTTPTKLEARLHASCTHGASRAAVLIPGTSGIRGTFVEVFGSRFCGQASLASPSKSIFTKLLEAAAGQPSHC